MKYLSLFSGIGGFELGIQQAYEKITNSRLVNSGGQMDSLSSGQETLNSAGMGDTHAEQSSNEFNESSPICIGYSEVDKYAIQIYERHFQHKNYGDITKIEPSQLPDFDLICGGFPCQSFSIAGKRGGFDDTRGTLFFDIARIIRVKRPRLLFLENVKGLLSHDRGRTFDTIIRTLDELGYDLQWQVLNSKNFGVPQNRERVFIIGHLRGTSRPQVFPIGEGNPNDIDQLNQPTHSNDRVYGIEGIAPTLNTMQGGRRQPKVAPTMRANHHNTADIHFIPQDSKIRRLTPTECERLQGFPDGWTEGISDSQRYKCLGNAVTVNVIKEIASRL